MSFDWIGDNVLVSNNVFAGLGRQPCRGSGRLGCISLPDRHPGSGEVRRAWLRISLHEGRGKTTGIVSLNIVRLTHHVIRDDIKILKASIGSSATDS